MITFNVDENNDLTLNSDGNLDICSNRDAAVNICRHYALAARNEMLHKYNRGMPFLTTIFTRNSNVFQFEAAFRARMRELDFVDGVSSFDATIEDGVLKYTAFIKTTYGEISLNGNL